MAIAKIKKIEIIGLEKDKDRLLNLLQKLGLVELINIQEQAQAFNLALDTHIESNLLELQEAISFLASFSQEKSSTLGGMFAWRPVVYKKQLEEVIANFDYQGLLGQIAKLRDNLNNLQHQKEKLYQEKLLLIPWQNLKLALDEIRPTATSGILLGVLNRRDYAKLKDELEKEEINFFMEVVNQDKAIFYPLILYIKTDLTRLDVILRNYHFNFVSLPRSNLIPRNRILDINKEILNLDKQLRDIRENIVKLATARLKLMILYDYWANIKSTQQADTLLNKQKFTFILSGWAKQKDLRLLEREIKANFQDVAIFISKPSASEDFPVDLDNPALIQPFEFITKIYGMPKYSELDPTPFLAPFFFLYFGFCVSDAGYGLLLVLISWIALKKFKMGPQGLRFFRLFLFCGISTIIIGALTGSWFGNALDLLGETNKILMPLKKFKDALVVLDPLKQPTKLLSIALLFGIMQVWFGNIVAAIGNIKNRRYFDLMLDQIPILTFLFGLTGLGLIFLGLLGKRRANLFQAAALWSAIALVLTQGRTEKGIGAKLFYGAYNLYNAFSGYLSDILSYSRLWALGLVTGVMANTVNLISIQFSQIIATTLPFLNRISFIKILVSSLVLIIIFVGGHMVSFLMNLLGAFVHPLRLQFVEFFSKFFKSGGRAFKPFKVETKYINIS